MTAQVLCSLAPPMEFVLRNLAAGDALSANGFDGHCVPLPTDEAPTGEAMD